MNLKSTHAALLLILALATPLLSADWTEFRGPTGQGLSSAKNLPLTWSDTENVAWKQELPGKGWSSPIILKGRIYLTSAVPQKDDPNSSHSLRTFCLDVKSGKVLWDVEVFEQQAGVGIHGKNSHASPTPITDGKQLFVHFGTHGTACLDLDGNILWTNRELKYAPVHGNGGSPVLVNDLLVLGCDGADVQFIVALDQKTGKIRWKTPRDLNPDRGFTFSTPLVIEVAGKKQIVSQASGGVFAYDPADGGVIWSVLYGSGYSVVPRPVFGHGLVFVCTGYNTPQLLAIRPDGAGDVTETHVVWQSKKAVPHNPSPLLVGEELYMVSDGGVATCLDAKTGTEHWQQRLGGAYSASPIFADGRVYFQSEAGEGIVVEAGKTFKELARNPLKARTLASYAAADGFLLIRTETHLARMQSK